MKAVKKDIIIIGLGTIATVAAASVYHTSTILTNDDSIRSAISVSILEVLPFIRTKEKMTSYQGKVHDIKVNLINQEYNSPMDYAILYNRELDVNFKFNHLLTYPAGGYDITIVPVDSAQLNRTVMTRDLNVQGNHIIRYGFTPIIRAGAYKAALNAKQFAFESDLDSITDTKGVMSGLQTPVLQKANLTTYQKHKAWVSGPVYINTSPKDATIEILYPEELKYTPGMIVDVPQIQIKVTAPNHIFIKRWLTLSDGKNIFVAPLQKY